MEPWQIFVAVIQGLVEWLPISSEGQVVLFVYNFGQVSIDRPIVDYKGNCGNISSAVGPFAVDEGLVPAIEPITRIRIHQKNTDTLIVAEVPVKNGRFDEDGNYSIAGVPGTGA